MSFDGGISFLRFHAHARILSIHPYFICSGRHSGNTDCTRQAMLIEDVERLIEEYYTTVQVSAQTRQDIAGMLHAEFDRLMACETKELDRLVKERGTLERERFKLMQAHYADAVPLDMLKSEQDRISTALERINLRIAAHDNEYADARENLEDSIGLLAHAADIYRRCDDANRRLCNQAFFTAIFIDDDGEPRVTYQRPYDTLCDPEVQANALNWAAEAKTKGEVQTGTRAVTLVEGLNLATSGSLRREFSNPTPRLTSLISRWKRGVYRVSERVDGAPIHDVRGPVVRRIGKPQTFLTPAEVYRLVDDYLAGLSVGFLAQKYGVHRATVSKHLTRNNVVRRQHGLTTEEVAEALKLYGGGISMRAIARTLGVGRKQVRVTLMV